MKLGEKGSTYLSIPPNLQNDETYALSYAVDRQIRRLTGLSDMVRVWSNLDAVPPRYYSLIAACIKAPYYDSNFDDATKLAVIKGTLATHRLAGSRAAIRQLISNIFGLADYHPWFDYGGAPYHFKITTDTILTPDIVLKFGDILEKVKRARSVIDAVNVHRDLIGNIHASTAICSCTIPQPIKEQYNQKSEIEMISATGTNVIGSQVSQAIIERHKDISSVTDNVVHGVSEKRTINTNVVGEKMTLDRSIDLVTSATAALHNIEIKHIKEGK